MTDDYEVCGDGESWRGCGNTGAERRGARTGPGGSWVEWFETPCSHCGRVSQDETVVGLPVRVLTSPKPRPAQTFAEVVADAEAYAGNLFSEAIEAGAPLAFTEILARASGFAEVRYDQAVEAATAPPEANVTYDGSRLSTVVILAKLPDDHPFEDLRDVATWAALLSDGEGGMLRDVAVFLPEDARLVITDPDTVTVTMSVGAAQALRDLLDDADEPVHYELQRLLGDAQLERDFEEAGRLTDSAVAEAHAEDSGDE